MKKTLFVRLLCVALVCALLIPLTGGISTAAESQNPIRKVGLVYGSDGPLSAKVQNYTGTATGFTFGYYDDNRHFVSLTSTDQNILTVTMDANFRISDGTYVSDATAATGLLGGYHLCLASPLTSLSAATAEAERLSGMSLAAAPAYLNGRYNVVIGQYTSSADAESARAAAEAKSGHSLRTMGGDRTVMRVTSADTDRMVFFFSDSAKKLAFNPIADSGKQAQTWFSGYRYYGGFEFFRNTNDRFTVVNVVDMPSYIKGVIPYEISASWPVEAQKAQALCAKMFIYTVTKHSSAGFDICDNSCCQTYRGNNAATALSDSAVDAVADQIITYDGKPISTYYCASNGGASEDCENVWSAALGYLRGKVDPYEDASVIPNYRYTNTITADEVAKILRNKGYAVSSVTDMYISKYTRVGNVYTLTIVDGDGKKWDFNKASARSILGSSYVKSQRFTVEGGSGGATGTVSINNGERTVGLPMTNVPVVGADGKTVTVPGGANLQVATGNGTVSLGTGAGNASSKGIFTVTGTGNGHNIGMSQWGLYCMAKKGMTYDEMLKFYYTGITISKQ